MSYATISDLIARFGEAEIVARSDRTGSGVVDTEAVERALADAAAEIDGYIGARYTLPLPAVPAVLTRVACDIARYRLWQDAASEEVRTRYEDARRLLEAVSRGVVSLGVPLSAMPPSPRSAARSGQPAVFARSDTEGF